MRRERVMLGWIYNYGEFEVEESLKDMLPQPEPSLINAKTLVLKDIDKTLLYFVQHISPHGCKKSNTCYIQHLAKCS